MSNETKILATGGLWVGSQGVRAIGSVLSELMDGTKNELIIVAYRFTSSLPELRNSLEAVLSRGCEVKMILDSVSDGGAGGATDAYLNHLLKQHGNFCIWDFTGRPVEGSDGQYPAQLHAKAIMSDRQTAVVGSANFSRNGLVENHELAVMLSGKPVLALAKTIDRLIERGRDTGVLSLRTRD